MRYTATSVSTTAGTPSGSVTDTQGQDDLRYTVTEDNTTGITSVFTISTSALNLIPDFLRVVGWYSGSGTHYLTVAVYNFNSSTYVDVGRMQGGTGDKEYLFRLGSTNYHDPATGEMRVRFLHSAVTYNPAHTFNVNNLCVEKAVTISAVWDEVISPSQHNVKNSAAYKLWRNADTMIHSGIAQGPGSLGAHNQIQLDTLASASDGAYDPALVFIVAGTGAGQSRNILQYVGSTRTATVDRSWKIDPAADSEFIILSDAGREHVNEGLAQGGSVDTIILNPQASDHDDCYNSQLVFLRSGPGEDQARRILDYEGLTRTATVSRPWVTGHEPTSATAYVVLPTGAISDNCIGRAVWSDHHGDYAGDLLSAAARLNSLLLASGYTAPNNSGIVDIKAITDQIRFTIANQIDANALTGGGGGGEGAVDQAQLDALLLAFGALAAGTYAGGSVSNPTPVSGNKDIILFADTDHDGIEFNVGAQWSTYLNEADSVPWFTVKADPRQAASLIDAQAVITDPNAGLITLSLDSTQTDVKEGTFFWQLKLVRTIVTGTPPDEVTTYKKRMLMEGKVYIKPTFKV